MKIQKTKIIHPASLSALIILLILSISMITGCSDSNVTEVQSKKSKISSAGEITSDKNFDSTIIRLDMNLKFKSGSIVNSKLLESNNGTHFNHIVAIESEIKPNEILDLQELQPFGIFSLYLSASGTFTLSNSDGMALNTKSILLEKCAFIDLKLKNLEAKPILIQGFVAGD